MYEWMSKEDASKYGIRNKFKTIFHPMDIITFKWEQIRLVSEFIILIYTKVNLLIIVTYSLKLKKKEIQKLFNIKLN